MAGTFILASGSRTRADMLERAGLAFEVVAPEVDERSLDESLRRSGQGPDLIATRLAEAKALEVSRRHPGRLALGADQTLALGAERLSKAATVEEARRHLLAMRGRAHALHSGFALARDGAVLESGVASAHLTMRAFSEGFLDAYLERAGTSILGSVGCYQLEGLGVTLFERLEGDHFTILGLPLVAVLAALRRLGVLES